MRKRVLKNVKNKLKFGLETRGPNNNNKFSGRGGGSQDINIKSKFGLQEIVVAMVVVTRHLEKTINTGGKLVR